MIALRLNTHSSQKRSQDYPRKVKTYRNFSALSILIAATRTDEFEDIRKDYSEKHMITIGHLERRMVIVGYVQRGSTRHIFSMRKANQREIKKYQKQFEEN